MKREYDDDDRLIVLERAHNFDITALSPDGNANKDLLNFGRQLIYEGLFRLPFPAVYLETTFTSKNGPRTLGIIGKQGAQCEDSGDLSIAIFPFIFGNGNWHEVSGYCTIKVPGKPIPGHSDVLDERVLAGFLSPKLADRDSFWAPMNAALGVFVAGIVGIQSKGVVLKTEPAPEKLNKKREKQGKPPIYEHRIVTLGRPTQIYGSDGADIGDRSSPRMHWRRGHLRDLPSGKRVPVSPALVGVAENGVISHEYRIRRSQGQTPP